MRVMQRDRVASFGEGKDSPAEAISALLNLADLHVRLEQWDKAIRLNERALDLAREYLPEHPLVGEVFSVLAASEHSRGGDLNRAEQLYRQAIEIEEKVGGDSESFADTLEGRSSVSGPQDPELAPALSRLAWLYGAAGEEKRAEETWKRALALVRPIAEVDRDKWVDALEGYAAWLEQAGRDEEALGIREEAMRAREDSGQF